LFDIDIPGKITFKESTNLSPGNELTVFDTREWIDLIFFNLKTVKKKRDRFCQKFYPVIFKGDFYKDKIKVVLKKQKIPKLGNTYL
jgi:hypothetical protein